MLAKVYPGVAQGTIKIPTSKSLAHRAIICASLANGTSRIKEVNFSQDILKTIAAMQQIGAQITRVESDLIITGVSQPKFNELTLDCYESGSTLRFLIPLAAIFAKQVNFTGQAGLFKRPNSVYEKIFLKQGLSFKQTATGITLTGPLKAGEYLIAENISSQFVSGLLMALPLLAGDSQIKITVPLDSQPYLALTLAVLKHFSIFIKKQANSYYIAGKQQYQAQDYQVETDYSQLAFFAVLAAINAPLEILTNTKQTLQGDAHILNFLKEFGASVLETKQGYLISPAHQAAVSFDLKDCPDLGPILLILGTQSPALTLTNVARLRFKESDRLLAMENALTLLGYQLTVSENEVTISQKKSPTQSFNVPGANDHRIVMSLAILATISTQPVTITTAEAISKSYPHFFTDLARLQIKVETIER